MSDQPINLDPIETTAISAGGRSCDCGWTGTYSSQAKADYALRRHSCDKQRRRDESAARGRMRRAAVDRTRKPCLHEQADHRHGTYACYVLDRCRCLPCTAANREYERRRTRQQAYGRWNGLVDADPVRAHIAGLRAHGMGLKRIAAVSGVPHGALWKLVYGKPRPDGTQTPSRRCRPATAAAILATRPDLAAGAKVDPTGTVRRLQALVAIGWSQTRLAARIGIAASNFTPVILGRRQVTAATARAVVDLYEQLWDAAPPETNHRERIAAARARNRAAALGWPPPMAWDDDTIDDPTAAADLGRPMGDEPRGVDDAAVLRRAAGDTTVPLTRAERWAVVRRLHATGLSDRAITSRTGIADRQVFRDRQTLGLPANAQEAAS